MFNFDVDAYWQYDLVNVIGSKLVQYGYKPIKYVHESIPLIERFRNVDSWESVTMEMEKCVTENNISV